MKTHALAVFHQPPADLNCAQAVLDAYQTVTGKHVATITDFKPFGGGRAPENECGALYAACQAAPDSATAIRTAFAQTAGATSCRMLKRELHFPCAECVALAAGLLQQNTPTTASLPK
ncbi:MAG: redox-active protein [Verrucomicrobia bacterium]|nr:redox-active protein [Verrucomicrobiota bacterium]